MSAIDQWDWARYGLGVALVLCNIGVWRGVALEESHLGGLKEAGKKLLIKSLALEAFFAAALFVVDTVGYVRQKSEILALTIKAGDAEQLADAASSQAKTAITALNDAQRRLAELSDKESELEQKQSDFLDALTPRQLEYEKFAGDLAGVAPVPIIIETEPDPDSQNFAPDLWAAFSHARWRDRQIVQQRNSFNAGIWIKYFFPPTLTDDTARKAAQAICRALNEQLLTNARVMPAITVEMQHERFLTTLHLSENDWLLSRRNNTGALDWPDSAPAGAVVIHIAQNRNWLFFNRARIKKGLKPIPFDDADRTPPCE